MFDLIIIGGGPGGSAATVYAARKRIKTLLITDNFGGQSIVSHNIQNWIGFKSISGPNLAKVLEEHVQEYAGDTLEIHKGEKVEKVFSGGIKENNFSVKTNAGEYKTKTILITTGSSRKKLKILNADKFENKGIVYCATCDGPLFSGQDVVVIGGGNSGFESASQLLSYTKSVTLLDKNKKYKADAVTVKKVLLHPNMTGTLNTEILEIIGDKFVSGIKYRNKKDNTEHFLKVTGIFVEIGAIPTTSFIDNLVKLNETKQIIVDPMTQKTHTEGIWAAGDCTNGLYHQNNIAVGDAIKALEDIFIYLQTK